MDKKYYIKNIFWGFLFFGAVYYQWNKDPENTKLTILLATAFFSCFLYPLAKKAIEVVALKFTKKEFWHTGFFIETPAKNGLYVLYYGVCFTVAIPVGLIYLAYLISLKKAT
ncbi:TPA: colicin E1 family microcin immunity protein [Yersinia enterocolitica]